MRSFSLVLATLLASQAIFAQDQGNGGNPPPPAQPPASGNPVMPVGIGAAYQPGDYQFTQYNRSQLEQFMIQNIQETNKADRQYFLEAVNKVEKLFLDLQKTIYALPQDYNPSTSATVSSDQLDQFGLKGLSRYSSVGQKTVPAETFANAIDRYMSSKQILEQALNNLKAIKEAFPSAKEMELDGRKTSVPMYGNVDFTPIVSFYQTQFEQMESFLKNLKYVLTIGNSIRIIEGGKGLEIPEGVMALSSQQIAEYTAKEASLRRYQAEDKDRVIGFTDYTLGVVLEFLKDWGTEQRYRNIGESTAETKESDQAIQNKQLQALAEIFWIRSYLRGMYGVPMGALNVLKPADQNKWFNLDILTTKTTDLLTFGRGGAWSTTDLNRVQVTLQMAEQKAFQRSINVFGGDASFIARVNSALTYLGGFRNLAQATRSMIALLSNDLQEEQMVAQFGATDTYIDHYKTLYFGPGNAPESKEFFKRLAKYWGAVLAPDDEDDAQSTLAQGHPIVGGGGGSLSTEVRTLMQSITNQLARVKEADDLRHQIRIAMRFSAADKKVINDKKKKLGGEDE